MNLEELKTLWQAEQVDDEQRHSAEEIRRMLYQRSRSALSRINRSIIVEGIINLLIGLLALMVWIGGGNDQPFLELWIFFTVLAALGSYFYIRKYRQLNRMRLSVMDLRSTLKHTAQIMAGYMRLYYYGGLVMVPLLSVGGILYGLTERGRSLADFDATEWGIVLGVSLAYLIVSFLFVRWYINQLYGKPYRELKACLAELEEADPPPSLH